MNIANLNQLLEDFVIEEKTGQKLALPGERLDLKDLFDAYLDDGLLQILNLRDLQEKPGVSITATGTGGNTIFSGMPVEARFSLVGDQPAVLVTGSPDLSWTLASSFPKFAVQVFERLAFKDVRIYLTSHDGLETLAQGVTIEGRLLIEASNLQQLAWLLGNRQQLYLKGHIDLAGASPKMSLLSHPGGPVELPFLTLPSVSLELSVEGDPAREDLDTSPVVGKIVLHSTFDVPSDGLDEPIPLTMVYDGSSETVTFNSNLTSPLSASLDAFAGFLKADSLSDRVPADFPLSDELELLDLQLEIDLEKKELNQIEFGLKNAHAWILWEDVISIEALQLAFTLEKPFGSEDLSMLVSGDIGIGQA